MKIVLSPQVGGAQAIGFDGDVLHIDDSVLDLSGFPVGGSLTQLPPCVSRVDRDEEGRTVTVCFDGEAGEIATDTGHRGTTLIDLTGYWLSEAEQLDAERAGMVVSRFQARAALMQAGLLTQVETAIAAADDLTKLAWADAQVFLRSSPTIAALAGALNLTDAQVDDLFRVAAQIEA